MKKKNDGGCAFPFEERTTNGQVLQNHFGMSLRDYFAGQALAAIISTPSDANPVGSAAAAYGGDPTGHISSMAYELADAMLAARDAQS